MGNVVVEQWDQGHAEAERWLGLQSIRGPVRLFRPPRPATDDDRHGTTDAVNAWAARHGFHVGETQGEAPRGLVTVDRCDGVAKWRNLTDDDRKALDGVVMARPGDRPGFRTLAVWLRRPDAPYRPRCRGDCCRLLAVWGGSHPALTPERMKLFGELNAKREAGPWTQEDAEHAAACGVPMAEDAVQIAGMLEYMGTAPLPGRPDSDVVPRWRCKHLQGCGDCGIYATRPALCRDHAEVRGSVCDVETCARRPLLTGPTTAQVTEVSMLRLVPSAGERAFVDACREAERYGSPRVWEDEP